MRSFAILAVGLFAALAPSLHAQRVPDDPLYKELQRIGEETTVEGIVPGMAVACIRDGKIAWTLFCGYADPEDRTTITPDTVFNVGSVSKSLSAWGLMRLVETGRVEFDAPVNERLKRWQVPGSEQFDVNGVTLGRILSHTAGLNLGSVPDYRHGEKPPAFVAELAGDPDEATAVRLIAAPGAGFQYSGGGYSIAQLLVEEVTKKDFADYMRTEVFQPLGMETADYGWTEELGRNAARPHDPAGKPTIGPRFNAVAAAGCHMSVKDLARFVIANMTGFRPDSDEQVLGSNLVDRMHTKADNAPNYGLGFLVGDIDGIRFVAHTGGNLGWVAKIAFAPDLGEGIAIMMNGCGRAGLEFRETIEQTWRTSMLAAAKRK